MERVITNVRSIESDLDKYIHLMSLQVGRCRPQRTPQGERREATALLLVCATFTRPGSHSRVPLFRSATIVCSTMCCWSTSRSCFPWHASPLWPVRAKSTVSSSGGRAGCLSLWRTGGASTSCSPTGPRRASRCPIPPFPPALSRVSIGFVAAALSCSELSVWLCRRP